MRREQIARRRPACARPGVRGVGVGAWRARRGTCGASCKRTDSGTAKVHRTCTVIFLRHIRGGEGAYSLLKVECQQGKVGGIWERTPLTETRHTSHDRCAGGLCLTDTVTRLHCVRRPADGALARRACRVVAAGASTARAARGGGARCANVGEIYKLIYITILNCVKIDLKLGISERDGGHAFCTL
mgnify:CR=1 FL=1